MKFVTTPRKAHPGDLTKQKMDSAIYLTEYAPAAGGRTDWSRVELSFEFNTSPTSGDPFDDAEH